MERGMSQGERKEGHNEGLQRDEVDIGTGFGGGVAPVLPTDIDPAAGAVGSSGERTQAPNWTREAPEAGREEREPLRLAPDTHLLSVFGEDLGRIEELYGYAPSTEPQWAAIRDGDRKVLVPVMSAQLEDDGLHVPYPKELIESAPALPDHELTLTDEMAFYSHYNERRILPSVEGFTHNEERTLHVIRDAA